MKKYLLTTIATLFSVTVFAQLNGSGYYRIQHVNSGRYITIVNDKVDKDNRDKNKITSTSYANIYALKTVKPASEVVCDPGSVIYIEQNGSENKYILKAQGMDTKELTNGRYLNIYDYSKRNGVGYLLYASSDGIAAYLKDYGEQTDETGNTGHARLNTKENDEARWYIKPVNGTEEYVAVKPEFSIDGKYYATYYASFPFSLSTGMKAYYVRSLNANGSENDMAELVEITGDIPAATPIILECSSANPTDNKITLLATSGPSIKDNLLNGVYFSYVMMNALGTAESTTAMAQELKNVVNYDSKTMRVIGEVDGKIGLVKASDMKYLPANKAYIKVPSAAAANIKLLDPESYATSITGINKDKHHSAIYTISGTKVSGKAQKGVYIVDGKKIIVK